MACSFEEILSAARCGAVRMPAEMAGYLALAAVGSLRDTDLSRAGGLVLESSGSVTASSAPDGDRAESMLRRVLSQLLVVAASENLALAAAGKAPCAGLRHLASELEAGLVPINRGAAKRSLIRLHRQVVASAAQWSNLDQAQESPSPVPFPLTQPLVVAPSAPHARQLVPEVSVATPVPHALQRPSPNLTPILGSVRVSAVAAVAAVETTEGVPQVFDPSLTPHVPPAFEPVLGDTPAPPALDAAQHRPVRSELWQLLSALTDEALDLPLEAFAPRAAGAPWDGPGGRAPDVVSSSG